MGKITNDWLPTVNEEAKKEYYKSLYLFIKEEYSKHTIYPEADNLFKALHLTPLENVKVVILGQDPYHEQGQAEGLSFSVPKGIKIPPSLQNIYKEIKDELGCYIPNNGSLVKWAEQGVLLLNTVLTVRAGEAFSHRGRGWERFTDAIINTVNNIDRPIVYLLWGKAAGDKASMLDNPKHLVLKSPHPSPLSAHRGFFGNGHFKKTNEFLVSNNEEPIDWQIEDL